MIINLICNLGEDAEIGDLVAYNTVVAWNLRQSLTKMGVECRLVPERTLMENPPPKADHTIALSNIAMTRARDNRNYRAALRDSTRGELCLWLDASWVGWDNIFDHIFTVVPPFPGRSSKYLHVGYGADPAYLYPEQREKAVFLDSLMWGKYDGKYDYLYKLYTDVLQTIDLEVISPVPVYNKSRRLPWLEMQAERRKCHFFCVTQLGGFGLSRMEAATCGSLIVQPKKLYREEYTVDLNMKIWNTREDLIEILSSEVDVEANRLKALEHSWDKSASIIMKALEGNDADT